MRFLITLARAYPWQSALMVAALLLAGILEGAGLSMMLPLLSIAMSSPSQGAEFSATTTAAPHSGLARFVSDAFATIGLTPTLETMLVVIIVTIVLKSVVMLMAKKQIGYTVARVATDLRLALLRALLRARWQYYLSQPVGKFANAMATESGRSAKGFQHGVVMISELVQAVIVGCVAVIVSWETTLIALAIGLVILYVLKRFVKKARKAGLQQTKLMKSLLALMTDVLQSIKPLKAMARENVADFLLENKTNRLNKALRKEVFNSEALKAFQDPLLIIFMAAGLYAALRYWHISFATIMVLAYLLARLIKQLNKVQERYQQMANFESAYWSIQESIQNAQEELEPAHGSKEPTLEEAIRLERVSFAYNDQWVLRNASLSFPAGEILAVVGPSGSGKTTIMDLLTGLLQPQEGEVWIDELPLEQVDLKRWRRMIGYIPQETLLLHDTILNNITLGDTDLDGHDAVEALRSANALDFVNSLPEGINTFVGERGGKISGGQRQRIAIARALVHRPKLLILDEATSALDPEAEAAICETLTQLRGNLTILVISHQPALVKIADRAYRIEDGIITENEGTHS
jgi:ATP-binding cassette subfamily C protein